MDLSSLPAAASVGSCDELAQTAGEFLDVTSGLMVAMFYEEDPAAVLSDIEALSALGDEYAHRAGLLGCSEEQMRRHLLALLPPADSTDPLDQMLWGGMPEDEPLVDLRSQEVSGG